MDLVNLESILFYTTLVLYLVAMAAYFFFFVVKSDQAAKIAKYVFIVAFGVHTACLIVRGLATGHLPFTNQYEFASSFAWGIAACFIIFLFKFNFQALGAFVSPVIILIIGYAAMQSREVKELMPALQSRWLAVHVCSSIIGYGGFGVAFAVSLMFVLRQKYKDNEFWKKNIPLEERLDSIAYRAVSLGFLFLTFCIITGAIWAEQAWGSYWSWDPKETWALITWFIYAIYLHLRITKGWKGKSAAIFAIIGFICVIFTYIGVNTLLPGVHSYATILWQILL